MNHSRIPAQKRPLIFHLTAQHWKAMLEHVSGLAPEEACGLVAGVLDGENYRATAILPITNALHSTLRYSMEPQEQLDAFEKIEALGWKLIGIFHSHPRGPGIPSPTDIAEAYYPQCVYLIWSGKNSEWGCRGFWIQESKVQEVPINISISSA